MKAVKIILVTALLAITTGCEKTDQKPIISEKQLLQQQNTELKAQLECSTKENAMLKEQLAAMTATGKASTDDIYKLEKVELTKYTNFYDHNKDGKKELLITYLKPIDTQGDIIKAAGKVNIQLWDLNQKESSAMIAQWDIPCDKLGEKWFSAILGTNYRFAFDITDKKIDFKKTLTIKATFTDRLSGKTFQSQKVIEPKKN